MLLLCRNMGGDVENSFVIGKAAKPRGFENLKADNVPDVAE